MTSWIILTTFLSALAVIADARSLPGGQHRKNTNGSSVVADSLADEVLSPKDAWEVNQGLNLTLFQGDIVLTKEMSSIINDTSGKTRRRRAVKKRLASRWTNAVVAYAIDRNLSRKTKNNILESIQRLQKHTCLKFHKRHSGDVDYLRFVAEDGCWSTVGRKGGRQDIGVGKGCGYVGTILHEIGHALGFWHEQSRSDRDSYVRVLWRNIDKKFHEQFDKMDAKLMDSMGYAYDYESVMHYGRKFFSKNKKATIRVKKPRMRNAKLGQRKGLSNIDIAQINAMYNCNKIATANSAQCIVSRTKDGRDYRGDLSYTEKGVTCQIWNSNWPHRNRIEQPAKKDGIRNYWIDQKMGLMERKNQHYVYHNHCRNPKGRRKRPWCYTTLKKPSWQYCDLKIC